MIRKFEINDTEQVMQLWLTVNTEVHDFIPADYWISKYHQVQEQILLADIYVSVQDQMIQGFAGMTGDYLAGIFIGNKFRSKGIGKSLLEYIKADHPSFSLNVYQKNQRAVNFYLREGLFMVSEGTDADTEEADYTMMWSKKKQDKCY